MTTIAPAGPSCPRCGGQLWDNRTTKRNPKAPDWKCKDRSCDGAIWPARQQPAPPRQVPAVPQNGAHGIDMPPLGAMPFDEPVAPANPAAERLRRIFHVQELCFAHAVKLATSEPARLCEVPITLEGLSALTAQALIAFREPK